ncbi:MAG: hypothetical protein AB4057_00460 [Crocosphaera sp.]
MSIKRADGITESERYLKSLCDHTFLSLWSYPGVYRDQISGTRTEGKEVCDLLVVFKNHIIIFSDKDCQFPNSNKLDLDWNRWFKRAIQKSADQVWGAERWIKQHPERLFLDRSCTSPFPVEIPHLSIAKFHLVVVAHDNSMRCQQELGGSGSLMIHSSVKGSAHYIKEGQGCPFMIGDIDPKRTFVHILDDTSLNIVLQTLDTVSDFVAYLTKKEQFLRGNKIILAAGEEELLAYYLRNMNEKNEHDFIIPDDVDESVTSFTFDEGFWEEFQQSTQRQAQILADRISYFWDGLIEKFSKHILEDTQYYKSHPGVKGTEPVVRFLAAESRFLRRILARKLLELITSARTNQCAIRYITFSSTQQLYYVFLTLPHDDWMTYEVYREARWALLEAYCSSVKLNFPDAQHIVGIATEPGLNNRSQSEDAMYLDATNWTEEDAAKTREIVEELNIFKNAKPFNIHDKEYPL